MQTLIIGMATGAEALVAAGFTGIKYPANIKVSNLTAVPLSMLGIGVELESKSKKGGINSVVVVVPSAKLLGESVAVVAQIAALNGKKQMIEIQVEESETTTNKKPATTRKTRKAAQE